MEAMSIASRAMDRQKGSHHLSIPHFENRLELEERECTTKYSEYPSFQPHNFILTPNSDFARLSLKGRCMLACAYECMHLGMDAHCTSIIIERGERASLPLS